MIAGKTCDPLDENNDFTRGVESQTFPLLPFLVHCVLRATAHSEVMYLFILGLPE